jgi:ketosteroid isomerase-like protein
MSVTEADIDELLVMLDQGRQSWIDGNLGYGRGFDVEQDEDMTIFGPFGGEALRGTAELAGRQDRAASLFGGGEGRCELVKTIRSDDVVVIIQVERNEARVQGASDPQPWVLRTTQVFERRGDQWVRLHRHADPLIDLRTPERTFAIARGAEVPGT